jgi:ketosteroid isomerase-like protein
MKPFNVVVVLFYLLSVQAMAQTSARPPVISTSTHMDKRVEREINKAEDQLERAIRKRDVASLDLLLADYYADAYEGSERAVSKRGTLAKCKAGTLSYYRIEAEKRLSVRGDLIQVEGLVRMEEKLGTDTVMESDIRLKRLWTKKGGRWLLISQTLEPINPGQRKNS